MPWKMSTYGSSETLDLGVFKIVVIYRHGTKESPLPDSERYEFEINGLTSKRKFSSAEEAKKSAIATARARLKTALEKLDQPDSPTEN